MGAYTSDNKRKSKKEGKLKRKYRVYKKGGNTRVKKKTS